MENISPQRIPNTPCASLRPNTHFSTAAAEFHLNGCGFAELGILNFLQDLLRKPSRLARIFRIGSPAHLYEWYVGVKTNINIIYYITSINRLYIVSITICIYIYILVGSFNPSEKIWKSVGMMKFPIYETIKAMFQTTNQIYILYTRDHDFWPMIYTVSSPPGSPGSVEAPFH